MKEKLIAIMLVLSVTVFAVGCNKDSVEDVNNPELNNGEETQVINGDEVETTNNDVEEVNNTDETINLDETNSIPFPKSYTYESYSIDGQELLETGTYTYPDNLEEQPLLPIEENMSQQNVIDTYTEDGIVYTSVEATMKDGSTVSILFLNSADTNNYLAASVSSSTATTLYSFYY